MLRAVREAHRNAPRLRGLCGYAERAIARLIQRKRLAVLVDRNERHTRLIDERAHRCDYLWVARGLGEHAEEIVSRRIAVRVTPEIVMHAQREFLRTHVALEHREHLRAFLISDAVERTGDLPVLG